MIGKHIVSDEITGKKWFELLGRSIKEADWEYGSVFISASLYDSVSTHSFIVHEKPNASYCFARSEKNARRIFHRRKLI